METLSSKEQGIIRTLQVGALRHERSLYVAGLSDSPLCPLCGEEEEDVEHILWRCRATVPERRALFPLAPPGLPEWDPCLRCAGLVPEHLDRRAFASAVLDFPAPSGDSWSFADGPAYTSCKAAADRSVMLHSMTWISLTLIRG